MGFTSVLIAILTLTAGIGVFLVACQMMSANLEAVSSKRLKQLFSKTGKNKWLGVGIGTVGTAAIQSSGAVTVMVIGFVNVGILSLAQAATIIYGANIGTTVTAQLVALGMFGTNSISTTIIFSTFAGIGAFVMLFGKHNTTKQIGGILTGFGMLFVGLSMMAGAMDEFAASEAVRDFLANINNVLLLVLVGAVLTAIIQSSSVMTSIAITMVVSSLVTLDQGIYLTMGSNIGSCVVAIIAGLTSGTSAKRTALIHLIFNVMGVVLFLLIGFLLRMTTGGDWGFGQLFERLFPAVPQLQLAMFHTVFNICTMLVAMPLTNALVNLACKIVSEPSVTNDRVPHLRFLNEQMLRTPVIAIRQMKAEIENMAELAMQNFQRSIHIVTTLDFSKVETFRKTENELNYLNKELVNYTVKLSGKRLNSFDQRYLSSTIRTVSDLERIGDYAENIVEYAEALKEQNATFSEDAVAEIREMERLILNLYKESVVAYHKLDLEALEHANRIEDEIDDYTEQMERNHIERLVKGVCSPSVGAEYLSLAKNSERIGDHLTNMGKTIRELV